MNRKRKNFGTGGKRISSLLLASLLGVSGTAYGDSAPSELKLFLAPGSGNREVIVFSPQAGGAIRRQALEEQEAGKGDASKTAQRQSSAEAVGGEPLERPEPVPANSDSVPEDREIAAPAALQPVEAQGEALTAAPAPAALPQANAPEAEQPDDPYLYRPSLTMGFGQRVDNLNWTISARDGSPNILSELDWRDISSNIIATELRYSDSTHLYFRGNFQIGVIYEGSMRDSDYLGDDRTMEFSRSKSDTEDGSLYDLSGAVGYRFDVPFGTSPVRLHLVPLVGYTYNSQEFDITHGRQILADYGFAMEVGEFSGHHSSYDTLWKGPWLGVDVELRLGERHTLTGSFGHYWFDYEGQGNWNLREDFAHPVSFRHDADGEGTRFSFGYRLNFHKDWYVSLSYSRVDISTDRGHDTTYFSDGSEVDVPFNGASWDSHSWVLGVGYNF